MEFAPVELFYLPNNAVTRLFNIAGAPVKSTVTTTWLIMAALVLISWLATKDLKKEPEPGSLQNIMGAYVEAIANLVETTMESKNKAFVSYIGTLTIYLVVANLVGIIPGRDLFNLYTPTADLNTTLALAFITAINVHFLGVKTKGIGAYLKGYFEPMPLLFPINVIGAFADPISLAFRLFGNMMGSVVIMALLFGVVPLVVPGIATIYFDVFAGVLQAFIFSMLTMTYISMEVE
ncbi:F0F1 ATP synthase subunit A [Natroniella sulfidigena]|uniref:F0F1 ATP synthase subunit A n=1 Tax=Natroniella sulfidigena TaxID=723921 RepID=UPI00200B85BA|nr:F0F1 ATP synthase subunit A [Natroniella sulfidigena]MCK8816397.1 F0F1 ATP synthase subunit A [Natroniella sulfidigena]